MVDIDKLMPTDDVLFKKVLGDQYNTEGLIDFLNAVLKPENPIVSVKIMNPELTQEHVLVKGARLDILATTSNDEIVNIECQTYTDPNFLTRLLRYWALDFTQQTPPGEKYSKVKRTISIAVLTFCLSESDNRYKMAAGLCDLETHQRWTDLMEFHVLQLPNLKHIDESDRTTYWMQFFKDPYSDEAKKVYEKVPVIKEALSMFEKAKSNDEVLRLIRLREEAQSEVATRIAEGEKRGAEKERAKAEKREKELVEKAEKREKELVEKANAEKRESAKTALSMGLSVEQVAKITGFSVEEISEIKKKVQ